MVTNMIPLVIHGFCCRRFVVAPLKLLLHSKANFSVAVPSFVVFNLPLEHTFMKYIAQQQLPRNISCCKE